MDIALLIWMISFAVTAVTFITVLVIFLAKNSAFTYKYSSTSRKKALEEAQQIVTSAHVRANQILKEAKVFNEDIRGEVSNSLERIKQKAEEGVEEMNRGIVDEASQELNNIIEQHNVKWEQLLEKYEEMTRHQLDEMRVRLDNTTEKELDKVKNNLAEYQKKEEERITKELEKKLPAQLKKVVGRTIPVDVHKDMVREALTKAGEDKVF